MFVQSQGKKGLTVKDLIVVGVFMAILSVCAMVGGIVFAITPTLTFYYPIGAALLPGPVFLLLMAKVPKRGALTIIGVIVSISGFTLGMHWAMCLGGLIGAVLADILAGLKSYRGIKLNILAYIVYALGPTGTYLAYFVNPEAWAGTMLKNGTTQDYIDAMQSVANLQVLIVMYVGTILVAGISGTIGGKLLKKQFKKAGITA